MTWNQSSNCVKHTIGQPKYLTLRSTKKYLLAGIALMATAAVLCCFLVKSKENTSENRSGDTQDSHQKNRLMTKDKFYSEESVPSAVVANVSTTSACVNLSNSVKNKNDVPKVDRWGVPKHKRRFDTGTEYILARVFSTKLGHPPPPVPHLPRREMDKLDEILSRPTQILPDDSQSVREMKQYCDLAKQEFKKFKAEGGDASEFLDYYQTKLKDYYNQWLDAQKIVHETAESGDVEGAKRMADEINKRNAERGIRFVTVTE